MSPSFAKIARKMYNFYTKHLMDVKGRWIQPWSACIFLGTIGFKNHVLKPPVDSFDSPWTNGRRSPEEVRLIRITGEILDVFFVPIIFFQIFGPVWIVQKDRLHIIMKLDTKLLIIVFLFEKALLFFLSSLRSFSI